MCDRYVWLVGVRQVRVAGWCATGTCGWLVCDRYVRLVGVHQVRVTVVAVYQVRVAVVGVRQVRVTVVGVRQVRVTGWCAPGTCGWLVCDRYV